MLKVEKAVKAGEKTAKHDYEVLQKYKAHLENFQNVRTMEATPEEKAVADSQEEEWFRMLEESGLGR